MVAFQSRRKRSWLLSEWGMKVDLMVGNQKLADIELVDPNDLKLDLHNPRMAEMEFQDEEQVLRHLIKEYDVDELVLSILTAGWLDYEPLIVERPTNTVIEGNRRLAALRLINDGTLREKVNYSLPETEGAHADSSPNLISVRYADDRKDAYVYIGFKHINGPFKWDSLAKAKFAADWLHAGHGVETVSRTLGDSNNTVVRLVNGWNVLQKAIELGFDVSQTSSIGPLPISHLYTALSRPDFKIFLGVTRGPKEIIEGSDITPDHHDDLLSAMSWIYGQKQKGEIALVKSQNPDLGKLVRVIAMPVAREELVANRDLDTAFSMLTPANIKFETSLRQAARACEKALADAKDYDGSPQLLEIVTGMGRIILAIRAAMQSGQKDPLAELADDNPVS
jgi:hypothetical protein